jgi:hypothetical protein
MLITRLGSCSCILVLPFIVAGRNSTQAAPQSPPAQVTIVISERAHPAVRFGVEELRASVDKRGSKVEIATKAPAARFRIAVGEQGDALLDPFGGNRLAVPDKAESFAISVLDSRTVVVEGRDATGAMYGAMELAEQIVWADGSDYLAKIRPLTKSPFLEVRGVNTFLTAQGFDEPDSWYWSDGFWKGFLDMMARSRHNFLDLHGPFDLTTGWPDGFSYFVYLPNFPEVGVGRERAERNLARFRQIIRMAAERGVKVGYMNYSAETPIGPWKTRVFWKDERFTREPQQILAEPRLEQYTREAVESFLKAVPELWMFGFRIGQSGQPEDFFKRTYVEAVKNLPQSLNLYARTWIADPAKVREIADLTRHRFYIEPKYNGEHLGLPYQSVLGGRDYPPSGSYEDYTNYPRNYSIIWQILANGTHRVFHWGWPDFARRTVRSCKFGGGSGFSMEPMNSYYPQTDYFHNNPGTDHRFYDWMYEQQWFWYSIWGRTGYDPDVSDRVWVNEFEHRFGTQAGPLVYRALIESSKIVPFVYAYHNQGLDHQNMAPEFETGDHAQGVRNTIWQGERLVPWGGSNKDFLAVGTLDRTAMVDPRTYVESVLQNKPLARMSPFEAGEYLGAAAKESERLITEAKGLNPGSQKEFDCIRMDVDAVAALGRYYRDRIASVTHLEFYQRTYHHPELTAAHAALESAIQNWDRLSDITEKHFGYIPDLIRMRVYKFYWRDEGRSLGVDLEEINRLEADFQDLSKYARIWPFPQHRAVIGHVPPVKTKPGEPLPLVATFASGGDDMRLHLFYRKPGETAFGELPLTLENRFERTWGGAIPADAVVPGDLEYYFEAYGGVWNGFGGTLQDRSPYCVRVTNDDLKPTIEHKPPTGPVRGNTVSLTVRIEDKAKVHAVRVYYKHTPAWYEWLSIDMEPAGSNLYRVNVPLTAEGILYYFEAVDENGNATHHPDFLKQTPYFVIDGWDAARTYAPASRP